MPRLFFAIETSSLLKTRLIELQDSFADSLSKLSPLPKVKPERLINSHCTVRFLGGVGEARIRGLSACVRDAMEKSAIPSFSYTLSKCGVFTNHGKARVIWIGLNPEEPFKKIQGAVDTGLLAAHIAFEQEHVFHPHLTLFRFREPYRLPDHFELPDIAPDSPSAKVSEVLLFESKTLPSGPVHTIRQKFVLA